MKIGKSKWLMSVVVAGGLLCSASTQVKADLISDAMSLVSSLKEKGIAYACSKGDVKALLSFQKPKITVRALDGKLCTIPVVAAWGKLNCGNTPDFAKSKCADNIPNALGDKDAQQVLDETAKNPGQYQKLAQALKAFKSSR